MSDAKAKPMAIITLDPEKGIQIKLSNWNGVSATMMDKMYHHMIVATQRWTADQILKDRQHQAKEQSHV